MIKIPNTDLMVSNVGLGTAKAGLTYEKADEIIKEYVSLGGNLIDTARVYSDWIPGEIGRSERVLGEAIERLKIRNELIIMTKGGHPNMSGMNRPRCAPELMRGDLEKSLKALKTECVDIYVYHRDDESIPVDVLIDTMEQFRFEGKIRYYACSNWSVARMQEADAYCRRKGVRCFIGNQSLLNAGVKHMGKLYDDTLTVAREDFIHYHRENPDNVLMPFSAVAEGYFHRFINKGEGGGMFDTKENCELADKIKRLSAVSGFSITQILMSYFKTLPITTIPLFGPRDAGQVKDMMTEADLSDFWAEN